MTDPVTDDPRCPYCGESIEIALDPGGGAAQEYVEDCEVCCRPIEISYAIEDDAVVQFGARSTE